MRSMVGVFMATLVLAGAVSVFAQTSVEPVINLEKEINWPQRHKVDIDTSNTLLLAENGEAKLRIALPKRPLPQVEQAAEELKRFLDQSTGADFQIVKNWQVGEPAIVLGGHLATEYEAGIDADAFPIDAFAIRSVDNAIYIAGLQTDDDDAGSQAGRATRFGVYDFLERFVGVRFYFPGEVGTVVPKHARLEVPQMDIFEAPDFWVRRRSSLHRGPWFVARKRGEMAGDPKFKNLDEMAMSTPWGEIKRDKWVEQVYVPQMYRARASRSTIPATHSLARSQMIERFGEEHPEYFALLSSGQRDNDASQPGHRGHLCYSNEGLADEIYQDAVAYLSGQPASSRNLDDWDGAAFAPGFFSIMPPDGMSEARLCRCEECQPYHEAGRTSDLVWEFIAKVARRLQENDIPGYVPSLAYSTHAAVPDIELPDNVLVATAVTGPWAARIPEVQAEAMALVKAWREKLNGRKLIFQWNYARSIYYPRVPAHTPRAIASYYKKTFDDFYGSYLESEANFWIFNYLDWYVFHKVTWDVSIDVDQLLAEHHELMFGPGAEPMARFFDRLEEKWMGEALGEITETDDGPISIKPSDEKLWTTIYNRAFLDELKGYLDEAEGLTADSPDHAKRVAFMRKWFLQQMENDRQAYMARKRDVEDVVLHAQVVDASDLRIDGKLNETVWQDADEQYMVVNHPPGTDPAVKTSVRAVWTDKYLILAFDCEEPLLRRMLLAHRRSDDKQLYQDASVEVYLHPSDQRAPGYPMYQWIVNARGVIADLRRPSSHEKQWDWDSGARAATQKDQDGWTLELCIPLSALDEDVKPGTRWVANFYRSRSVTGVSDSENQLYMWSPYVPAGQGFLHSEEFGALEFVETPPVEVSIIPNGSFEKLDNKEVPVGWAISQESLASEAVSIVDDTYQDGQRSLRLRGVADGQKAVAFYIENLQPDTPYLLTFFMKAKNIEPQGSRPKQTGATIDLSLGKGWRKHFPSPRVTGDMPWTRMTYEFTTPEQLSDQPWLRLTIREATGEVWFDDVQLRPVSALKEN